MSRYLPIAAIFFVMGYAAYTERTTHAFTIARATGNYSVIPGAIARVPAIAYREVFPPRHNPWTVESVIEATGTPRRVVEAAWAALQASGMTDQDIADFEEAVNLPEEERI